MVLTLPIREVVPATSRASIVRIALAGQSFPYRAGQALTIASHGIATRRPYSIASAPDDTARTGLLELLIGLLPDGTPGPHLNLTPGSQVDIEGPLGRFTFPDLPVERHFLFVAGGTGISPLRSMYRHALAQGLTNISVLYSARTADDFAYAAELTDLAEAGRIALQLTVTREGDERWQGKRGRIDATQLGALLTDRETLCFICGPRAMVDAIPPALAALGIEANRIRIEDW